MKEMEMKLQQLAGLRLEILENGEDFQLAKQREMAANPWFRERDIEMALGAIVAGFLNPEKLSSWLKNFVMTDKPKTVGLVMAGNIPLVGFHDLLSVFASGHRAQVKLSGKDTFLMAWMIDRLMAAQPDNNKQLKAVEKLQNCDAYIATGSTNTARYFEQYFGSKPNIIRKNRTSVAILTGQETADELHLLCTDIFSYYGLGCRNVTQICVPEGYDFQPLMDAMHAFDYLMDHNKYRNNYDYYLAIYLLNKVPYFTNDIVLFIENELPFSLIGTLHYRHYQNLENIGEELSRNPDVQCLVGKGYTPFGEAQKPRLTDYADGVDTMAFLENL